MEKYIPKSAVGRQVKYLAVSAHKDDIEMMAFDGILRGQNDGFAAVVLTHGGACPRADEYLDINDEDMAELRTAEQKRAAEIGGYEVLYLFEKSSDEVKARDAAIIDGLYTILSQSTRLDTLYLHNPFDRHPTHVSACLAALEAIKRLPDDKKPQKVLGCEVWRGLDWLPDKYRIALNVSGKEALQSRLMACFSSQNACKRYDLASLARQTANATYNESHAVDVARSITFAMDLTDVAYGKESLDKLCNQILLDFAVEVRYNLGHM